MLARLAQLTYRRRGRVLLAWIAILALVVALAPRFAGQFAADYATPGSESKAASDLVATHFPGRSTEQVNVVWKAATGARAAAPTVRRLLERARTLEGVAGAGEPRYSRDGRIGLVELRLDRPAWDVPQETGERLIDFAGAASSESVQIELGGGVIRNAQGGVSPEGAGLIAAAVVLLLAFGSAVAAGMPLLVAIFSLGISGTLLGTLAAVVDVPEWAPAVAALIGIGVGIDYALLVLTRFRSALAAGRDVREALVEALATAGRSVVLAGGTVVVSLLGLFFVGMSYLGGVALAASLAVLVVVAASVTLLPALLALAGRRVERLRIPGLGHSLGPDAPSVWTRWGGVVQARPRAAALAGTLTLLVLAVPAAELRFGFPDEGNDPVATTTRAAYELTARGFGPGANAPLVVVVEPPAAVDQIAQRIRRERGVAFVGAPQISPDRRIAVLPVAPASSPQDPATVELADRLRRVTDDAGVHIGGVTAAFIDQSDYVVGRLPLFIGGVIALSFLLLLVAFRAPVIALKAGLMNLASIAAAYGVVALAAEGGLLGRLLGLEGETPVPPFIPVMMFAILFGLSMDYEVFLLSRVREEYLRTGSTRTAVARAIARTARVITAAAAIMVVVFLAFVFSNEVFLKLMGVGMATAILVDATVVRMVLVPAVLQLLGRANWWLPAWLDRLLPRRAIEPGTHAARV